MMTLWMMQRGCHYHQHLELLLAVPVPDGSAQCRPCRHRLRFLVATCGEPVRVTEDHLRDSPLPHTPVAHLHHQCLHQMQTLSLLPFLLLAISVSLIRNSYCSNNRHIQNETRQSIIKWPDTNSPLSRRIPAASLILNNNPLICKNTRRWSPPHPQSIATRPTAVPDDRPSRGRVPMHSTSTTVDDDGR